MTDYVNITDPSSVAEARRRLRRTAASADLDSDTVERAALVTTELATNILRHAGQGRMLIDRLSVFGEERVAVVAMDKGSGIAKLERMMRDGESTAGGAGTGLGAIERMSDRFDIHTAPNDGTVVACEFGKPRATLANTRFDAAGLRLNYPGETVCGDAFLIRRARRTTQFFLCDGLGHGPRAAEAADEAVSSLMKHRGGAVETVMDDLSHAMAATRGAVAGLCQVDGEAAEMSYGGMGNISTMRVSGSELRRFPSRDGRLGAIDRQALVETVPIIAGDVVIMHSDGVSTLRGIETQAGLMRRSALTIAGVLLRDHLRGRDDASILVVKINPHAEIG